MNQSDEAAHANLNDPDVGDLISRDLRDELCFYARVEMAFRLRFRASFHGGSRLSAVCLPEEGEMEMKLHLGREEEERRATRLNSLPRFAPASKSWIREAPQNSLGPVLT